MGNIGSSELLVILVLALLLLGPRRLPEVGEALGRTLRRFRQASRELRDEIDVRREVDLRHDLDAADQPERPPTPRETQSRIAPPHAKIAPAGPASVSVAKPVTDEASSIETTRSPQAPASSAAHLGESDSTPGDATAEVPETPESGSH